MDIVSWEIKTKVGKIQKGEIDYKVSELVVQQLGWLVNGVIQQNGIRRQLYRQLYSISEDYNDE